MTIISTTVSPQREALRQRRRRGQMQRRQQQQQQQQQQQRQIQRQRQSRCSTHILPLIISIIVSCSTFFVTVVDANLLTQPTLQWSLQLNNGSDDDGGGGGGGGGGGNTIAGRGLRQGNNIIVHPGGTKLYATADDGSLHVVDLTSSSRPTSSVLYDAAAAAATAAAGNNQNVFVECRSGVTLVEQQDGSSDYLLYAVLDTPVLKPNDFIVNQNDDRIVPAFDSVSGSSGRSRVIAVNLDGTLRWTVTVSGRIEGNPIIGNDRKFVYVSHNGDDDTGSLSVILVNATTAEVVATKKGIDPLTGVATNAPLGPPAIQRPSPQTAGGPNAEGANTDVVVVAERRGDGYDTTNGRLYVLTPSDDFDEAGGRGDASYDFRSISTWPFSSPVPPTIVGDSLYFAAAGGNLAGYTGNQRNDLSGIVSGRVDEITPGWEYQAVPNPRNASQPFLNSPVVDSSGEFLVVAGVARDLYCLQTADGADWWFDGDGSQIIARPQIWENSVTSQSVVYVIENRDGTIRQHDLTTGERNWDFTCASVGGQAFCQDAVEADFAISPSGNMLYYGDILGRITSLQVANFPTQAPTVAPTGLDTPVPTTALPVASEPATEPEPESNQDDGNGNDAEVIDIPASDEDTAISEGEEQPVYDDLDSASASLESQEQNKGDESSDDLVVYVGVAAGGLCLILISFVAFRFFQRQRGKKDDSLVEVVDNCKPRDLESSPQSSADDEIVEIGMKHGTTFRSSPGRLGSQKNEKTKKSSLPGSPGRILSLCIDDELPGESPGKLNTTISTVVVDEEEGGIEIEEMSLVGTNLTGNFDSAAATKTSTSPSVKKGSVGKAMEGHLELAVGENNLSPVATIDNRSANKNAALNNSGDSEDNDDDDNDPPPPPPPPSSGWLESIWAGLEASAKENKSDNDDEKEADTSSLTERIRQQLLAPLSPKSEKSGVAPKSPPPSDRQLLPAVKSFSPSSMHSMGSNDDSLYTSTTGDKMVNVSNLSPLSTQIFDEDINPRGAADIPEDEATGLAQPNLGVGRNYGKKKFYYVAPEEGPDDERVAAPAIHYVDRASADPGKGKYGRSVRTRSGPNRSFVPRLSTADECSTTDNNDVGGYASLASVYGQLADSLRQDANKPSFRRRSKKAEDDDDNNGDDAPQPPPAGNEGDAWGSFLRELAEAEKHFFAPSGKEGDIEDSMTEERNSMDSAQSEIDFLNTSS